MTINVNGISLYYEVCGKGEPLILLHGNGETHHIFDELANKLASNFTLYAIDSRNHGQSEKTEDYSYEAMAKDICCFIEEIKLAPVNIIGFSDGAIISLLIAMMRADLISKMALLGVNLKPEDFTEENYQFIKKNYMETKDPLFKLMLEEPNIELDALKNVNIPTLLVAAENDLFKSEMYENLLDSLPNATLKIMEGHEHDSYIVGKDILYSDFIRFFK